MKVRYIGQKPIKSDNVAGTGAVWQGHGDVQEVPAEAWEQLSKHTGVWELVESSLGLADAVMAGAIPAELQTADDLRAFAAERNINVPGTMKKPETMRAHIEAALASKA